jgi:hypothetical protein
MEVRETMRLKVQKRIGIGAMLVCLLGGCLGDGVLAQRRDYNTSEQQVRLTLSRIQTRWNRVRQSLNQIAIRERVNPDDVRALDIAIADLRTRFARRVDTSSDVRAVLTRAVTIDDFFRGNQFSPVIEQNWTLLRSDLDRMASYYGVSWSWSGVQRPGRAANRLTGTYRISPGQSDDAIRTADRATAGLPAQTRERVRNILIRRLDSPEMLAIDRNGRRITIASSRAPDVTFEADGRTRVEQTRRGRTVRVTARLVGDQLTVSSTGDRGNDYRVSFDAIDLGQRLRVRRQLDVESLARPVIVHSIYQKTSEVAQLGLFTPVPGGRARDNYGLPDGMLISAALNERLDTRQVRAGDRFTLTVRTPSEYDGAVIEGYVSRVERSGRFAGRPELAFNLERIRLRNGRAYDFDGLIEAVRTPDGDSISVDNEGRARPENGQTERTIVRSGIGAAVGALIGAITGGGEGAAIGAAIGAGAGAGSVFVQGRDDLELPAGTVFTIRAAVPGIAESRR